jgi:hypothetical protein
MTLDFFRKLTRDLPGQMDIAIEVGEESIMPVCAKTNVVQVKFNDTGEERFVLVIKPCECEIECGQVDVELNEN